MGDDTRRMGSEQKTLAEKAIELKRAMFEFDAGVDSGIRLLIDGIYYSADALLADRMAIPGEQEEAAHLKYGNMARGDASETEIQIGLSEQGERIITVTNSANIPERNRFLMLKRISLTYVCDEETPEKPARNHRASVLIETQEVGNVSPRQETVETLVSHARYVFLRNPVRSESKQEIELGIVGIRMIALRLNDEINAIKERYDSANEQRQNHLDLLSQ
ncbi:MAG: hypothetical protein V1659_03975 [Candidatus Woesearchaeota archaeon]